MSNQTVKPGTIAKDNLTLNVKDAKGKNVGEINVPAGNRVPPSRKSGAESYSKKK